MIKNLKKYFKNHPVSLHNVCKTSLVLLVLLIILKLLVVYINYQDEFSQNTMINNILIYVKMFGSDLVIFGITAFLGALTRQSKSSIIKYILTGINISIALIFFIDIITILVFQSRLSLFEISNFVSVSNSISFLQLFLRGVLGLVALSGLAFFIHNHIHHHFLKEKNKIRFAWIFFFLSIGIGRASIYTISGSQFSENILSINIDAFKEMSKKRDTILKGPQNYEDYFGEIQGSNKRENVILIIAESLSTVDSLRAGGIQNNMPLTDKIQSEGITFTNFLANGNTSETAHIALLQGIEPRESPLANKAQAYNLYSGFTEPLASFFNQQGYQTTFLSTVTLSFLNERDFIKNMGFSTIIGEEAFANEKKYVFSAAPDASLYNKTLEVIDHYQTTPATPYFITLQTVSSHHPYETPYGTNKDSMMRYVDRTLYSFYQKLKAKKFFDNGVLIIVGDHHKMDPVAKEEVAKRGLSSQSRTVLTVIGKGIRSGQINDGYIQHVDIFNSLKKFVAEGKVTVRKQFNDIFQQNKKIQDRTYRTRAIRYRRFFERNYIFLTKSIKTNASYVLRPGKNPPIENYINAFKRYQYEQLIQTGSNVKADAPIIIAHRGAPDETSENSLAGAKLAQQQGAQGIEFDVSRTKDKQLIVLHGPSLVTTTCGEKKQVKNYTLADLITSCPLKNGESIHTLEEFLSGTQHLFDYFFLDIKINKPSDGEKQTLNIIDIIKKMNLTNKVVLSSYDRTVNFLLGSYQGIQAARDSFDTGDVNLLDSFPHKYFMSSVGNMTPQLVDEIKKHNKIPVAYVANTTGELQKLRIEGISMIMTDNAKLLTASGALLSTK